MSFASAMDIPDEPFKKKRRKGGIRQRLAAEETEASSTAKSFSSELGTSLVERWAWGTMSPQGVQDLAMKCKHDFQNAGAAPPHDIVFLSSMGTSGAHKPLGSQAMACIFGWPFETFFLVPVCLKVLSTSSSQGKTCTRLCWALQTKAVCCPGFSCQASLSRHPTTSYCNSCSCHIWFSAKSTIATKMPGILLLFQASKGSKSFGHCRSSTLHSQATQCWLPTLNLRPKWCH